MSAPGPVAGPAPPSRRREEVGAPPRLQGLVSLVLRGGVLIAAGLMGVGLLIAVVTGTTDSVSSFAPAGLVPGLLHGVAGAYLLLGVFVLIATPLTRVLISVLLFAATRDTAFVVITATVFVLLAASVAFGVHG